MPEKKPSELLELAYQVAQPCRGPGSLPMLMVIRQGKLQMIFPGKQNNDDICLLTYTRKMLTAGLSGGEWHRLCEQLIKHRKELKT